MRRWGQRGWFSWSLSSVHRLRCCWYWYDDERGSFSIAWGDGNADPVWCIDFPMMRAPWIVHVVARWRSERARGRQAPERYSDPYQDPYA